MQYIDLLRDDQNLSEKNRKLHYFENGIFKKCIIFWLYEVGGNVLMFLFYNHIQNTDTAAPTPKTSQKVLSNSNSSSSRHSTLTTHHNKNIKHNGH